ncbi:glycosyltransferase [Halorubrum sp. SP3]|uniref:glycosyltransferase n=1 Tax=unclassified Halorubrum TaxID=2642239 RepID=UPI0010F5F080|nr:MULTISPECIES: glycosyltransferase [unclassified Halorubrum]TKX54900.1 glycosyltransferase [Halorubrum sp. SP3]TKX71534.1 glycosyltransferase [Halorubrum sp. SP9]
MAPTPSPSTGETRLGEASDGTDASGDGLPFVSVVIPVYNDPAGIEATLDSLRRQTATTDRYEVIVVDNGSTDETRDVVREYLGDETFEGLRLFVEDDVQGSYAARNVGISAATGSVVAFIDADMVVDPGWVEAVAREMALTDAAYLACDVRLFTTGDEGTVAKYNRLKDLNVQRFVEELSFGPTCSLVVTRTLLEDVGGFDARLRSSGDVEFGNRVAASGRELRYTPDIVVYHPTRTTLGALLRKSRRVGRGKTQLRRYYPERYGPPVLAALNPAAFLPPRPSFMRRSVRDWTELPVRQQFAFLFLSYVASLAKAYGQLLELASPTDTGAEKPSSR